MSEAVLELCRLSILELEGWWEEERGNGSWNHEGKCTIKMLA